MRKVGNSRKYFAIVFVLVAGLLSGCDSGIHFKPKDWIPINNLQWAKTIGTAEFTVLPLGGLTGLPGTGLEMIVTNHSNQFPMVIVNAALKTRNGNYQAVYWDSRPFQPGETRKSNILWEFKGPLLREVLIDPVEVSITIRMAEEQQKLVIPMEQF